VRSCATNVPLWTDAGGLTTARALDLNRLPLYVITVPSLRLDSGDHRERLAATVDKVNPALLVLDPFIRLHAIDENAAGDVAPLLAYLRQLQRTHHVAVALVHHARKDAARARPGQALRGSSEFHAWGDSNLYLRRRDPLLRLSIEHRAAAAPADLTLELCADPLTLRIADTTPVPAPPAALSPAERIEQALAAVTTPSGAVGGGQRVPGKYRATPADPYTAAFLRWSFPFTQGR
jgi:hypothetical protein